MKTKLSSLCRSWSLAVLIFTGLLAPSFSVFAAGNTLKLQVSPRSDTPEILAPYATYNVTVPAAELIKLKRNFIARHLNPPEVLSGPSPRNAGDLLSPFAQTWLNRRAATDGPNCFHASLSGIFRNWSEPRFMDEYEHMFHLDRRFHKLGWNGRDGLEFGDVLVFYTPEMGPSHAAVYIGTANGEAIVFQKASFGRDTPYSFMKLTEAVALFNDSDGEDIFDIQAFRAHQPAVDPLTEAVPSVPILEFPGP